MMALRGVGPVVVLIMILALAGCGRSGSIASPTREQAATASGVAEETTQSQSQPATPLIDASPVDAGADLRQLAVTIASHVREQNWDAVRPFLPTDIAALDDPLLYRALGGALIPDGIGTDASDWEVEEYSEWTTARLTGLPFVALIFRERDDGMYVLDPGPHVLQSLTRYADAATPDATPRPDSGYQRRLVTERDEDVQVIGRHVQGDFRAVAADDESVTLTVGWGFMQGASGTVPLDGLTWRSGDAEGPVEIVWTTAVLTGEALVFPVPDWEGDAARLRPADPAQGSLISYTTSFSMIGAPVDRELRLLVDRVELRLPDGEEITFGIDHRMSDALLN